MGTGGEGGHNYGTPQNAAEIAPGASRLVIFLFLSGLQSLETLSGSSIAKHMIQQPRRPTTTEFPGGLQISYNSSARPWKGHNPTLLLITLSVSLCFNAIF